MRGEGIAGLSQAFLYAGAERVVVSTWEVNDLATSDLMKQVLCRPQPEHGTGRGAAACKAVDDPLWGNPAYRHPYYWASFVLIGAF